MRVYPLSPIRGGIRRLRWSLGCLRSQVAYERSLPSLRYCLQGLRGGHLLLLLLPLSTATLTFPHPLLFLTLVTPFLGIREVRDG